MKVSVIIPVYNTAGEGKLNFCLDSILHQTCSDLEIIAVDDASTDESPEVLKEYAEKYPDRFHVYTHEKNSRQGTAKNTGLQYATGEWISFIDSDDWITPDYYEKLLQKAEETGADFVGCDCSIVREHTFTPGNPVTLYTEQHCGVLDEEKHTLHIMECGYMVTKIYKRSVIEENHLRFPEGIFYEDNCAGPLWSVHFTHFEKVSEPMYFYYQHSTSTVNTITESRCRDRMTAMDIMLKSMKENGGLEKYHDAVEFRYTELYFVNTLFSYMLGCKEKHIGFVKELKKGILNNFPNFRQNPYYPRIKDAEQKKMIDLLMKSTMGFYVYYSALWMYRRMR